MKSYQKHHSTHMEPTQNPLGLPENMPKSDFATQCRCNFGPSKLLRRPNQSVIGEQFQVPGRAELVKGRGVNRFPPHRSEVQGARLNTAQGNSGFSNYVQFFVML